ncbi:vesicle-associated protein 1-1-like isoform X3 [Salvia divinorum]|uniref:Vesicle-associated protein 1-1-like isoform X3 n=1 Tax=Salvia divinorum TaxID=28513 RepID=A0ABD1HTG2_SALDI
MCLISFPISTSVLRCQPQKPPKRTRIPLLSNLERRVDQRASSTFRIWNDSSELFVAFKVKTTDPLKFRGEPIYGILMPQSYRDVDGD